MYNNDEMGVLKATKRISNLGFYVLAAGFIFAGVFFAPEKAAALSEGSCVGRLEDLTCINQNSNATCGTIKANICFYKTDDGDQCGPCVDTCILARQCNTQYASCCKGKCGGYISISTFFHTDRHWCPKAWVPPGVN